MANSDAVPSSPFQKRRTASRYLPFHSIQPKGKLPTWYPPAPKSHGSAISFTCDKIGILVDNVENAPSLSTSSSFGASVAGQIETEAVHVHLDHPVAQAVHDQLQHAGMAHVQRVAAAGVIHVITRIGIHQPVIGSVVDAAEAKASGPTDSLRPYGCKPRP